MLVSFFKKIWIICFTDNPYRVKKFNELYNPQNGVAIDNPESVTAILKQEAGEILSYSAPSVIPQQKINYRYLNKTLRFRLTGIFKAPDRFVYSIADGNIISQVGLIYDGKKRAFINESAQEWVINIKKSPYVNAINLPAKTHLNGITFSFLTIGADYGFYHFLFESIVKKEMYGTLLNKADHLLFNGLASDWKLKWLNLANIDTSKILWMDGSAHYECEQLIFTNRLVGDQQINKWGIDSLKKLFKVEPAIISTKKVIWISRKGMNIREIMWEDTLLGLFPEIERLDLSLLSANETIDKFKNATHVIGPHGAGFSNIYLCNTGVYILELYPNEAFLQPCYSRLSEMCGLNHLIAYINFENENDWEYGLSFFKDILKLFIDPNLSNQNS